MNYTCIVYLFFDINNDLGNVGIVCGVRKVHSYFDL